MENLKHIASVSWGRDSLCMLLLLIKKKMLLDEVVFYDTGMEFQAIYDTRDAVLPILKEHGITYTELQPSHAFKWRMLHGSHGSEGARDWCGGPCRWGAADKLQALNSHCGKNIVYVGLAHDEFDRIPRERSSNKRLPLVDWGISEGMALVYCYQHGYWYLENGVPLYSVLQHVSCWCCANKNITELRGYYNYLPDYWDRLLELQKQIARPMKGKGQSVFDLDARFKKENEDVQAY